MDQQHSAANSWQMTLAELVTASEGKIVSQTNEVYTGVGTDTRADLRDKVFVALKGENFDAHDFLDKAVRAGAGALVVHRLPTPVPSGVTIVQVDDTLKALQRLGHFWRHKMKARILGITGTNGKTTTKEFTAALLNAKFQVQYSKGSFNNHWGVPISLLSIDSSHEIAVIEMGMNHPGELTELSQIVDADVVVVTMVGRGHLEGVGSVEGVARAKAEIYEHAPHAAMRVFNLENEHTRKMYETSFSRLKKEQIVTFASLRADSGVGPGSSSIAPAPDVAFEVVEVRVDDLVIRGSIRGVKGQATVPVFGRQNTTNLMAAASLALACGMTPEEIWQALPRCKTAWGRNQWVQLQSGARALFDAYNANPESMGAAVENFASLRPASGGKKIAILGEMRELGEHAPALHRELAERVAQAGFDEVCFIGPSEGHFAAALRLAGFHKKLVTSISYENKLAPGSLPVLDRNDMVLIKGSRGMQLEKVLMDLHPLDFKAK